MENMVAASRKTHFEHGLIWGWAMLSSTSTAESKAVSSAVTFEQNSIKFFGYFQAIANNSFS